MSDFLVLGRLHIDMGFTFEQTQVSKIEHLFGDGAVVARNQLQLPQEREDNGLFMLSDDGTLRPVTYEAVAEVQE